MLLTILLLTFPDPMPPVPPDPPKPVAVLTLPASVVGKAGAPIRIQATTTAKKVRWRALDAGIALTDREDLADQRVMIAFATTAGKYRVVAWCAADTDVTDLVECVVTVEGPPLPPIPPTPPKPDTLTPALTVLYGADTGATKAACVRQLAALYRQAADDCDSSDVKTSADLLAVIRAQASKTLLPADAILGLRSRIAEEVRATIPATNPPTDLTPTHRAQGKALFTQIATILEGLK